MIYLIFTIYISSIVITLNIYVPINVIYLTFSDIPVTFFIVKFEVLYMSICSLISVIKTSQEIQSAGLEINYIAKCEGWECAQQAYGHFHLL